METLMFVIPHFYYHVEEWKDTKSDILPKLKIKNPENIPSGSGFPAITSYWDDYKYEDYSDFVDMIKNYLHEIPEVSRISRIWFQTSKRYEYHVPHTHGAIGWSAIFYADYDPSVHQATKFYCPHPNVMGGIDIFLPKVSEGDLIIFPSNILHEASMNTSDVPRTIISFNME